MNSNNILFNMMVDQMVDGKYHLQKLLGVGGFGGVFLANEVILDRVLRQVALKIIVPSSLDSNLSQAEQERKLAKDQEEQLSELMTAVTLDHPHILRGFGVGEFKFNGTGFLYLVMEQAEYSLEKRLTQGALAEEELFKLIEQIASGLQYLHDVKKIVHRDLKPGNILYKDAWKLTDFGLVRNVDQGTAHTSSIIGSIAFMPPEAFSKGKGTISAAWDIWSLGILIVAAFQGGKVPYDADSQNQLLIQVINSDLKIPTLPPKIAPLVKGCLEKERSERWTSTNVLDYLKELKNIEVQEKITPLIGKDTQTQAEEFFNQGEAYYKLNDFIAAIKDYSKAISINPNYVDAYFNRGKAHYELKNFITTIEDYSKAISINPNYANAYFGRGGVHYDLKNFTTAIEDYSKSIVLAHNYTAAYFCRGKAYCELKNFTAAIEDYSKAISINPNSANAYFNRGNAHYNLNNFTAAIEDYSKAISINPNYATAYCGLGNVYYNLNNFTAAIEDYSKAISINPMYAIAYYNRGKAYEKLKDFTTANADYAKAKAIDTNYHKKWKTIK